MPSNVKLPTADTDFKQSQSDLGNTGRAVYAGMVTNPSFPTPPIAMIDYVVILNNYNEALSTAVKGSKSETADKTSKKVALINALRVLAAYVNTVAQFQWSLNPNPNKIASLRVLILSSGFKLSKIAKPIGAITGMKLPIVKSASSKEVGQLNILLRQYTKYKRNTKLWRLRWRVSATTAPAAPAGPWMENSFTSGNIAQIGLSSGVKYDWQVASIGGRNTRLNQDNPINFTPVREIVII